MEVRNLHCRNAAKWLLLDERSGFAWLLIPIPVFQGGYLFFRSLFPSETWVRGGHQQHPCLGVHPCSGVGEGMGATKKYFSL